MERGNRGKPDSDWKSGERVKGRYAIFNANDGSVIMFQRATPQGRERKARIIIELGHGNADPDRIRVSGIRELNRLLEATDTPRFTEAQAREVVNNLKTP